ncbi:RagB/SusD family nutrient uptake outer membrane protein [Parapedobacter sp. 2B3]|uniref:RagB/SusD family nutrient uptake outer membrane protein n=1 Tax=Parapedobacter sp. 2B3 TaxID=3342381 RepID=UPI0035B6A42F
MKVLLNVNPSNFRYRYRYLLYWLIGLFQVGLLFSCKPSFLEENLMNETDIELLFRTKEGFETYIVSLHEGARQEHTRSSSTQWASAMNAGTDIGITGSTIETNWKNYETWLTPTRAFVDNYWQWAYRIMLVRANTVIHYAEDPDRADLWDDEAERNRVIAEARFFRAYTHNLLANLYGGVPVVETYYTTPKTDFVRSTREEVYESARRDLEFASEWLPSTVPVNQEGRIVKAAADHLLTEVYVSLGLYDEAIESASRVIDSELYQLMTERFGKHLDEPGDAFSDLFKSGNQNRSSGNRESIYVWQFEDVTQGGLGSTGNWNWRMWGPFYIHLTDPDGRSGMILADSLSRGVAFVRPTTYFLYDLWKDDWTNDIRNSPHNIKRVHYYNNPSSAYFGQVVEKKSTLIDTMQNIYPLIRKVEGPPPVANPRNGRTTNDIMVYRLAETYLLRAEAYFRNGNAAKAADDINAVRARARAHLISASDVNLDYILDERGRELIVEEPRRRTLTRMGKLVERSRKYSDYESTKSSIEDYHEFFPIPQREIDANSGTLEQTIGYF